MAQMRSKAPVLKNSESLPPTPGKPATRRELMLKRLLVIGGVAAAILLITGITGTLILNALSGTRHESTGVAQGVTTAAFATLTDDNAFPLGIARAPDGTIYLTAFGSDVIYKVAADGSLSPWLTSGSGITAPGALTIGADGSLYVLDFTAAKPGSGTGVIKRITPDGKVSLFANQQTDVGLSFLSQLTFDGQGNLYVTYTVTGEVWRFPPNAQGESWLKFADVDKTAAGPTGITYDKTNNALIVSDGATGSIYRVAIKADGSADRPLVLYRQADFAFQGMTFDSAGRLLVLGWQHDNGQLAQLTADGKYVLLAQSFRAPSMLLPIDSKVYVVNSDLPGIVPLLHAKPPFTVDVVSGIN